MDQDSQLIPSIFKGWRDYQAALIQAIMPLTADELAVRIATDQRSVREIVVHIIGARAGWFRSIMEEGDGEFVALASKDYRAARSWSAAELVSGLETTWEGMQAAINGWRAKDWQQAWPGEYEGEPEVITRQWVIWHIIEHDLHHGGEVSIILGANGIQGLEL